MKGRRIRTAPGWRTAFVFGARCAGFLGFAGLGYGARLLQPWLSRPTAWRLLDGLVGAIMLVLAASLLVGAGATTH
jgi:L-lysine exporter family protein LysE/ArgO